MKFVVRIGAFFAVALAALTAACAGNPAANAPSSPANAPPATATPTSSAKSPQKITFESADKAIIVGTFYEPPQENSPAVLLLHQWGSDRHSYDELAKRLNSNGFGVLAIDGRGFGESVKTSDGKAIAPARDDASVKSFMADIDAAFYNLAGSKNVDPKRIAIIGASYGSSFALIYAAAHPEVKAVALLSPGINYFGNIPTDPAARTYGDRPLLLVAAEDDRESAETVRKLAGVNKKFESQIYRRGGHGTGILGAKVGLDDVIEQFLKRSLKTAI